ncbi:hypothetical protein Q0590_31620 [Rhodocytophaga aerolata]|uniref:Rpn family recombination-promoting nuclease/putative transposase n=2 Tax=Rhodocytophaga aerolata TaxID=455078 RepID=A0ABT8RGP0_9BACT|nr:hypothetical protein [Rhodocytophaga aerolata]MDO1450866.1 hypothetical protein [Rhodocytophaga aerolata]
MKEINERMAQEYDKIIKENLEKVVLQLIRKTTHIDPIKGEVLYPELHYTIEREADFVEKITTNDNKTLVFHIEFQTANDKSIADRMFVYAGLIYKIYRLPLRQIVFYIGNDPVNMPNKLSMPTFEYNFQLIDLQSISYKEFIHSNIPEEVLLAILCNFGGVDPEMVVEEIFSKLRSLQDSNLNFQRSVRQLDMLSLLRNLQPLILKQEQKMALTLDIKQDLRYKQGAEQGAEEKTIEIALEMLKKGLDNELVSEITKLPIGQIETIRLQLKAADKNK